MWWGGCFQPGSPTYQLVTLGKHLRVSEPQFLQLKREPKGSASSLDWGLRRRKGSAPLVGEQAQSLGRR